jgi:hypothetical protein
MRRAACGARCSAPSKACSSATTSTRSTRVRSRSWRCRAWAACPTRLSARCASIWTTSRARRRLVGLAVGGSRGFQQAWPPRRDLIRLGRQQRPCARLQRVPGARAGAKPAAVREAALEGAARRRSARPAARADAGRARALPAVPRPVDRPRDRQRGPHEGRNMTSRASSPGQELDGASPARHSDAGFAHKRDIADVMARWPSLCPAAPPTSRRRWPWATTARPSRCERRGLSAVGHRRLSRRLRAKRCPGSPATAA